MSSWALGKHKNLNCKLGKYVEFFSKFKAKSELVEVVVAHRWLNHSHGVLEMVSIGSAHPRIEGIFLSKLSESPSSLCLTISLINIKYK